MDNDKLIKQLSQEGKNVPDNRKKIINAAKAEGLLTDNAPKPAAVYNGGGTVSAVKGNRIIAAIASVFVLGTVTAAAVVPFVAGNNGGTPGIPSLPSIPSAPVLCTEKLGTDYAIGAVSAAKLLGCFGISNTESGATATPAGLKREGLTEQAPDVETQINNFGTYFGAFGAFFGEGEEIVAVSDAPVKNEKYPNSVVIAGKYANGEDAEYAMYYLEALDIENSTDDEEIYYLEGEIYIDKVYYYLEGSRTFLTTDDGAEAYDLVLKAYPDATNKGDYVQMTVGYREVNDSYTKSYDYKVFKNGNWLTQTLTYFPSFDSEEAFNLILNYGGRDDYFTVERPVAGEPVMRVGYEIDGKRSSFKVSQTRSEAFTILMNNFMYDLNEADKTCSIRGYKAGQTITGETLEIPEEIVVKNDIYTVTGIGASAFFGRDELKKVIIPSTVKTIGSSAFAYSRNIEEVEFNEGLTEINSRAFDDCLALKAIYIPASVNYVAYNAFRYCSALENIQVASGNQTYSGAGNCLVSVQSGILIQGCKNSVIPADGTVKYIGERAFITSGIQSVNIPSSVISIGEEAFYNCRELEEVYISESVDYIYEQAFYNCQKLAKITLPDKKLVIGGYVFQSTAYMNDKSNWDIENDYEALYIGKHLISLTGTSETNYPDVVIKSGTLTIAEEAFAYNGYGVVGSRYIGSVTLNKELLYIGYASHIGGGHCQSIVFDGENNNYYTEGNCLIDRETFEIIAGCDGSIIPEYDYINCIGPYAFAGSNGDIAIPKNITRIKEYAFARCGMYKIEIPNSVCIIEFYAFDCCHYLSEVIFEELEIDENETPVIYGLSLQGCFSNCSNLTTVMLPKHTSLVDQLFTYCSRLSVIYINYDSSVNHGMSISNLVIDCENIQCVEFFGTEEQWREFYHGDIDLMPFMVHCINDDSYITPDYHE